MKYTPPLLTEFRCRFCGRRWDGFLPDGVDSNDFECMYCKKRTIFPFKIYDVKRNYRFDDFDNFSNSF